MLGKAGSCGVWVSDLTYANGRFPLIFTDVKRCGRIIVDGARGASPRDFHNHLVWCDRNHGPWSDAVHVNSGGFDPALFHGGNGRSWMPDMLWDHRPDMSEANGSLDQAHCGQDGSPLANPSPDAARN